MIKHVLVMGMSLVIISCSGRSIPSSAEAPIIPQKTVEELAMENADVLLDQQDFTEAFKRMSLFQQSHPQSYFFEDSRLKQAKALQGLGQYHESLAITRKVIVTTLKEQPHIAALGLYISSFSYEALGDDLKTVAALRDAQKMGKHLSDEIALAEIPARLAAIYARQGRPKEAQSYLEDADKGITLVQRKRHDALSSDWLGRTFVQMGMVSTNQLSVESFDSFVQGQRWVQVYLLKALKLNDPKWSLRAQNILNSTYRDLLNVFMSVEADPKMQNSLGGDFFDLLDQAELFRPLRPELANVYEKNFFSNLTSVRQNVERVLYAPTESMSLTPESQRLNSIKREGRVRGDSYLPGEKKPSISLPSKVVPSEDPNL